MTSTDDNADANSPTDAVSPSSQVPPNYNLQLQQTVTPLTPQRGAGIASQQQSYPAPSTFRVVGNATPGSQSEYPASAPSPGQLPYQAQVPIPRQSSNTSAYSSDQQAMVAPASGPMSGAVVVPQRPRPGRKPLPHEDAADRRRVQNRIAQRNFRDKRQMKLVEALNELEDRKQDYEREVADIERKHDVQRQLLVAQIDQLNNKLQKFQEVTRRAEAAEERAEAAEQRAIEAMSRLERFNKHEHGKRPPLSLPSVRRVPIGMPSRTMEAPTPPDESPHETDFTNFGRASNTYGPRPASSIDSGHSMDYSMDVQHDRCGFCTDDQNCACRQGATEKPAEAAPIGPGNCDMCRADPKKAAACRDLAARSHMSPRPSTTQQLPSLQSLGMPPPRISCSEMVANFEKFGERTSSISSLYQGQLNTFPSKTGAGYEIEEQQAAEVLSTLARRSATVEPKPNSP